MRAVNPITIAIREGIGKRLLELGFQRQGARMYLKETGDYSEWVHFANLRGGFQDMYGIHDAALERFVSTTLEVATKLNEPGMIRPCHIASRSIDHAKWRFGQAWEEWRANRRPWRPLEYFQNPPDTVSMYGPFISQRGVWTPADDPIGCAAATATAWHAHVEPYRARLIASPQAVAREMIQSESFGLTKRIMVTAYLGDKDGALALIEKSLVAEGRQPDEAKLRYHREIGARQTGLTIEEFVQDYIEQSVASANYIRNLRNKIQNI